MDRQCQFEMVAVVEGDTSVATIWMDAPLKIYRCKEIILGIVEAAHQALDELQHGPVYFELPTAEFGAITVELHAAGDHCQPLDIFVRLCRTAATLYERAAAVSLN